MAAILSSDDDEAAMWARAAVRRASARSGQLLDPISLGIAGAILIGSILAARVKKVGPVKFYEGLPKELGSVVKAGAEAVIRPN
jgi:hypothetical protein